MKKKDFKKGEVIIYKPAKGQVELKVHMEDENVWLSQKQMAKLFGKNVRTINEHIKNIFKEGELKEKSVIRNFRITASDGKIYETHFYSLDVIISVGYRVKSQRGVQFRIWATGVLKKYLLQGYAINEKKLIDAKDKFNQLKQTINFLQKKSKSKLLHGQEQEILSLLASYTKTLATLDAYDKGKIVDVKGKKTEFILRYKDCVGVIKSIKKDLNAKKAAVGLFGRESSRNFEGIIRGLYQTFRRKQLYNTIEEKAAHLLYLTIKDHPFVDGNKRIGAFLFVYFLDRSDHLYRQSGEKKVNDNALTTLALLVAESDPKEKELMVALIKNLIAD